MRNLSGMARIPVHDRAYYDALFLLEHWFPKNEWVRQQKAETRQRIAARLQQGPPGRVLPVDRVKAITPREFRRDYLAKGIPMILENGAADWPLGVWSFEHFRRRYGTEMIKLVQRKGVAPDHEVLTGREYSEEIRFGDFIDQLENGGGKYMRFSPLLEQFPELLDDFNHDFFRTMSGNRLGLTYQLFMGATGTFTPLHNAMTGFFFVNVCGVKRWSLIPNHYLGVLNPDADGFGYNHSKAEADMSNAGDYPGLDRIDRFELVMQPGDVLYLPSWMWHSVKNEAPTIGVRCGFVYVRGMLREAPTLSFIRLFAARNPSTLEALYHVFVKPNLPERDKWLLTAKLIRR